MEWLKSNCCLLLWLLAVLCFLLFYIRHRRRIRAFLLGSITGLSSLVLLQLFGDVIGCRPSLCLTNLLISGVLGIPGTALILLADVLPLE